MAVTTEEFFETQHTPSQVKSAIASNYFGAWSRIMTKRVKKAAIGYVDLFAGRGRFEDGSESTPMIIVRKAVDDPNLRSALKTFFNDKSADEIVALRQEIGGIPGVVARLVGFPAIPTFLFADPFGYMGISLELLHLVLHNQKSEALIFFNTNRINAGISNEFVREHIDALFGPRRAETVRTKVAHLHGDEREQVILESFQESLKAIGFPYVLRLRFRSRSADRTSHHLLHCSRHPLAERIMKEVMDPYSMKSFEGIPLFEIPAADFGQRSLFEEPSPPVDLARELLHRFARRSLTLPEIIRLHSPGTPYIERNYRAALAYLIDERKVTCDPPAEQLPFRKGKRIWPKGTKVEFPAQ